MSTDPKKRPKLTHNNGFVDLDMEEPIVKQRKINGGVKKESKGFNGKANTLSTQDDGFFSQPTGSQEFLPSISKIRITDDHSPMFVDKYKPKTSKDIIGQTGDRSNVAKLTNWLKSWHVNRQKEKEGNKSKKARFANEDDGSSSKAVLLSGPPGIGKTTSAQLVCKESGFVFKELNASDARSKRTLGEEVACLLENKVLDGYFFKKTNPFDMSKKSQKDSNFNGDTKHCIIMDEVDGMAGNEDRGGVAELIKLIKETKIPIICICNDRSHPKIRSLVNYCFDLRFYKPRADAIKASIKSIASKEGIQIDDDQVNEIVASSNQDIRQSLHFLNMIGAKKSFINNNMSKQSIKDEKIGPFEAIKRVFPAGFGVKKPENLIQKCDLFFYDYTLMPLMVFENYLKASQPVGRSELDKLKAIAETADAMSFGDVIEKNIRTFNNWSLLPLQAAFSVAMPATFMNASLNAMPLFPSFLGRLSNYNKRERLLQELKCHMNLKVSGNKTSLSLDYLEPLRDAIIRRVKKGDIEGVVEFLNSYYLRKEDFDAIMELTIFTGEPDPYSKIDAKIKTALTRAINKSDQILPYSIGEDDIIQKKSKGKKAIGKKKIKSEEGNEEEPEETESDIPEVFE